MRTARTAGSSRSRSRLVLFIVVALARSATVLAAAATYERERLVAPWHRGQVFLAAHVVQRTQADLGCPLVRVVPFEQVHDQQVIPLDVHVSTNRQESREQALIPPQPTIERKRQEILRAIHSIGISHLLFCFIPESFRNCRA